MSALAVNAGIISCCLIALPISPAAVVESTAATVSCVPIAYVTPVVPATAFQSVNPSSVILYATPTVRSLASYSVYVIF